MIYVNKNYLNNTIIYSPFLRLFNILYIFISIKLYVYDVCVYIRNGINSFNIIEIRVCFLYIF